MARHLRRLSLSGLGGIFRQADIQIRSNYEEKDVKTPSAECLTTEAGAALPIKPLKAGVTWPPSKR